ncbi:MAG: hypothetical protein M1822_008371 [Bathelium mastoideum]|nr:MAG: hypothetical protein M1822_008371 [Bathelium mastoideum]
MSVHGQNHRIIIGVDYGTTYTGISYVDSLKSGIADVQVIRSWPGKIGDSVWKTPSRIAYEFENRDCKTNQFGYQVNAKMKSYSWTKLLLDGKTSLTKYDDPELAKAEDSGMLNIPKKLDPSQVAGDYLREVYTWTLNQLETRVSKEIIDITPFEFWITIPAIWSDKAKAATKKAARTAGFASRPGDTMFMIPEPEAASLATLKGLIQNGSTLQVKSGDGVLVCDCGGGTVDITTYKILGTVPQLSFEELVEGAGGKCGSTYIDRQFHQWMSGKFGSAFDNLKYEKRGPGSAFMKDFEEHKCDFGSSDDLDHIYEIRLVMDVPDSEYYDQDESVVKVTGHQMLEFFNPVISKITALLSQQIEKARRAEATCNINVGALDVNRIIDVKIIQRLILVGGFGDSPHLNNTLRKWCDRQEKLRLLCPEHPQAAIARGAALRGLENIVPVRRRSRRHYGTTIMMPFREGIDPEGDMCYHDWDDQKFCRGIMVWHVAKGATIDKDTIISVPGRFVHVEGSSLRRTVRLYSCSFEKGPERLSDPGVEEVGVLIHTLTDLDLEQFESKRKDNKRFFRVTYKFEVLLGAKEGLLQFRVMHDGREMGKCEIDYAND